MATGRKLHVALAAPVRAVSTATPATGFDTGDGTGMKVAAPTLRSDEANRTRVILRLTS